MQKDIIIFLRWQILILICLPLCVFAQEGYTKKVLIEGRWGNRAGEFGIIREAGKTGPNSFALDNDGNIYIVDEVNYRIQRFNKSGKFINAISTYSTASWAEDIYIDNKGLIYLLLADKYQIIRIDNKGSVIDSCSLPRDIDNTSLCFIDKNDSNVYIKIRMDDEFCRNIDKQYYYQAYKHYKPVIMDDIYDVNVRHNFALADTGVSFYDTLGNKYHLLYGNIRIYNNVGRLINEIDCDELGLDHYYASGPDDIVRISRDGAIYLINASKKYFRIIKYTLINK